MTLTIVSAFTGVDLTERKELEGIKGKSYDELFSHLNEGDSATVEVPGKGYKEISVKNGQHFIQRNFSYEY